VHSQKAAEGHLQQNHHQVEEYGHVGVIQQMGIRYRTGKVGAAAHEEYGALMAKPQHGHGLSEVDRAHRRTQTHAGHNLPHNGALEE
jgi:hypothetical protein